METRRLMKENAELRALISSGAKEQQTKEGNDDVAMLAPPGVHQTPPGVHMVLGSWSSEMGAWDSSDWSQQTCYAPPRRSRRARRRNRQRAIAAAAAQEAWNTSIDTWMQWQSCSIQSVGSEDSTIEGSTGFLS